MRRSKHQVTSQPPETVSNYFVGPEWGTLPWNANTGSYLSAGWGEKQHLRRSTEAKGPGPTPFLFFPPLIFMLMYLGKSHHPQHPVSSNAESPFGFWCIMESCSKAREAKNVICFSPAEPLQAFLLYLKIASRAQEHFFIFFLLSWWMKFNYCSLICITIDATNNLSRAGTAFECQI